jgi:hypothetical protein
VRWTGLKHDGKCSTSLTTGGTNCKLIITTQSGKLGGLECHKKHLKEVLQNFISIFQYFIEFNNLQAQRKIVNRGS